jgi:transcriptional regulator with GAF, ATPase, and Fis domain/Tfp pilus assembly protein PilF
MSNARDDRDWLENNPEREGHTSESVVSPAEEIANMHFSSENFSTALEYFHKALESAEDSADQDKFRILLRICDCHRQKGDYAEARRFLDLAAKLSERFSSKEIDGKIEYRQAFLLLSGGQYEEALKAGFSSYRKLKKSNEHGEVASIQILIGHCYLRLGLYGEAEEFFQDALSSYRRVENRVGIAYAYNNLGVLHKNACRWNRALASLSKSLDIAKTVGLTQQLIAVQKNLGVVYGKLRRFPEAISSFTSAINIAERFGDQLLLTRALLMIGRTYVAAGEPAKAEKMIVRGQTMAEELGYAREATLAAEYLAELMISRGRFEDALVNLRKALKDARAIAPQGDMTAESLRRLADIEYLLNRPREALAHIEEGLEIAEACGEFYELGYFHRTKGMCQNRLGERDEAIDSLRKSIELFAEYGNPYEKAHSQQMLARLYVRRNGEAALLKAKHVLTDSIVEYGKLEEGAGQVVSQMLLASVEQKLNSLDDALLAVYEADRIVDEEGLEKFRKALLALRKKIESRMSRATRSVLEQFSVLGEMQSGARSREQLIKGLNSTLNLILDKLGAHTGFVAIPSPTGKTVQIASRVGMPRQQAQAILSWYSATAGADETVAGGVLITDVENKPEARVLREKAGNLTGTLLLHGLGFEDENLGVLCVHQVMDGVKPPIGQDALHFVGAYSSLISLSVYEIVRSERRNQARTKDSSKGFQSIVTDNKEMIKLLNLSERVAHSDATVLLQGETGTGKGLIAYAIHLLSDRRDRKFIHVNCAALPEQLLESELFGHVRGAFTGAFADKEGLLREADGGTIFLDEIGKTSLAMQGKLLQFLDTAKVRKVGSNDMIPVDVRVICASKSNLLQLCDEGRFLEDFFYRINDFPLTVPPLRDRPEDITLLMYHYVDKLSREMDKVIDGVTDEFLEKLKSYRWPGNVRELEKIVKRAIILADEGDRLSVNHLAPEIMESREVAEALEETDNPVTLRERIERLEQIEIVEALKRYEWNKSQAAIHLGISYPNLLSKIKRYNIQ